MPHAHPIRRWVIACAAGELIGIAVAALWWVTMDRIEPDPVSAAAKAAMLAAKGLSGLFEGAVLGLLQAHALRAFYPRLSAARWTGATIAVAMAGWVIGSSFSVLASSVPAGPPPPDPGALATAVMAAAFGLAVGALFGGAQAIALRGAARASGWWVLFNALGWAVALPFIYLAAGVDLGIGIAGAVLNGLAGGCAAGAMLGLVTALAFRRMPAR
ncbi:hypothetical protein ACFQ1E_08585 [Sphingomonas canadensis]|uniref:Uncharacterized protein n=1 Tax=Sphingomonas canadensis TaxID=1219257 RepID=A0ABW3H6U2_9SPHN|nr:hypothetical protein [Sphingomonas canadensis]MCW3836095.1 hypothetical protein [Sphingomonas canadensis]